MSDSTNDNQLSEVQKLIRLKRFEQPSQGYKEYCEDFLFEFQQRQRVEMLRRSSFSVWMEKIANGIWGFGTSKWVWGGAAAYASVMMFAYIQSDSADEIETAEPGGPAAKTLPRDHPNAEFERGLHPRGTYGIQPVSVPRFKEL